MKEYNLAQFTNCRPNLAAEASDLGIPPGREPHGIDVGINIRSPKTDSVYSFFLTEKNDQSWEYLPYEKSCPIGKVVIFND